MITGIVEFGFSCVSFLSYEPHNMRGMRVRQKRSNVGEGGREKKGENRGEGEGSKGGEGVRERERRGKCG